MKYIAAIVVFAALALGGCVSSGDHEFQYRDPGAFGATGHATWEEAGGRPSPSGSR